VKIARAYGPLYTQTPASVVNSYSQLILLYDALMAEFPDAITRSTFGADSNGAPLYAYKLAPPPLIGAGGAVEARPSKIIVNGCIHGHERPAALATFVFMAELCTRWGSDETLEVLRHGAELHFVPCINPSGLDANSRKNGRGVDLNRNFPFGWADGDSDPSSISYRGPSPASEPETQAYIDYVTGVAPAATIEVHNGPWIPWATGAEAFWIAAHAGENRRIAVRALRIMSAYLRRTFAEINIGNSGSSRLSNPTPGTAASHVFNALSTSSYLLEVPYRFYGSDRKTMQHNQQALRVLLREVFRSVANY